MGGSWVMGGEMVEDFGLGELLKDSGTRRCFARTSCQTDW